MIDIVLLIQKHMQSFQKKKSFFRNLGGYNSMNHMMTTRFQAIVLY